ncbi:SDR family NAD(P)-dependent oxidoreductase [Bradyrhizobium genosp. A]|uniref:SDR family NAD(P)-dependent oxidoreductase n=1 Tax=Bradyrhizobium genosp. A TaxID=83626 RepID=UPI003CE7382B
MSAEFSGKVAVVTGAASGIGLGLALRAAELGMKVALADVEAGPLEDALEQVRRAGAEAIARRVDVSDGDAVMALAATVEAELGHPWLVCNNAGVNKFKPLWAVTEAEWAWIVGVNMWGVIHGIRAFAPGMVVRNAGHIVNTSSAAGLYATPGAGPYVATKHAVVGLSECLYREFEMAGIDVGVSVLCPKLVATNMMTATRNEPGATAKPAPIDMSRIRIPFSHGEPDVQTPAMLANKVFDAVEHRRFWILSHVDSMRDTVVNRFRQAVDGRNPDDSSADRLSSFLAGVRSGLLKPPPDNGRP